MPQDQSGQWRKKQMLEDLKKRFQIGTFLLNQRFCLCIFVLCIRCQREVHQLGNSRSELAVCVMDELRVRSQKISRLQLHEIGIGCSLQICMLLRVILLHTGSYVGIVYFISEISKSNFTKIIPQNLGHSELLLIKEGNR